MRNLQFRAWFPDFKEMVYTEPKHLWRISFDGRLCIGKDHFPDQECFFMQFTGVHDKKGTPVYEGDIVSFRPSYVTKERLGARIGEIVWSDYEVGFVIKAPWYEQPYKIFGETDEFYAHGEVIGNIFQNPELMEKSCTTNLKTR